MLNSFDHPDDKPTHPYRWPEVAAELKAENLALKEQLEQALTEIFKLKREMIEKDNE